MKLKTPETFAVVAILFVSALLITLRVFAIEFLDWGLLPDPPRDYQYVMVDQNGNIWPTNAVATVADAAATAARVAAAEQAAEAYRVAEAQTSEAVDDLAVSIIDGNLVVYEDDFVYSLGDAVAVSTNCVCAIYDWQPKVSAITVEGVECWRCWVYFGFTENIGSLSPVAQFKSDLGDGLDWSVAVCGEAEPQNHTFTMGANTFDYCYKMSVDIPKAYFSAFIRVFTEVSVQIGDGSALDIMGGVSGGRTETVQWGEATIEFLGGLAVVPAAAEVTEP